LKWLEVDVETEQGSPVEAEADARGGYLGFVAHEVRNPLSTALWSAELLARMTGEERGGARGEKLTAMCLRSLARVRQLVEDHFLCERLDARGIPVRLESIALRPLLDEVAGRRALDLGALEILVGPEVWVDCDRQLLDRGLEALLSVAGREGAAVRVEASEAGGRVQLRISGAPADALTLDDPRKGSPGDTKGRALALPLARRVAAALGGSLSLDGEACLLSLLASAPGAARGPAPA
jgi:signal transduction histidine kinase